MAKRVNLTEKLRILCFFTSFFKFSFIILRVFAIFNFGCIDYQLFRFFKLYFRRLETGSTSHSEITLFMDIDGYVIGGYWMLFAFDC